MIDFQQKKRLFDSNVNSLFLQKLYNKRDFKACEARKSGVYST